MNFSGIPSWDRAFNVMARENGENNVCLQRTAAACNEAESSRKELHRDFERGLAETKLLGRSRLRTAATVREHGGSGEPLLTKARREMAIV